MPPDAPTRELRAIVLEGPIGRGDAVSEPATRMNVQLRARMPPPQPIPNDELYPYTPSSEERHRRLRRRRSTRHMTVSARIYELTAELRDLGVSPEALQSALDNRVGQRDMHARNTPGFDAHVMAARVSDNLRTVDDPVALPLPSALMERHDDTTSDSRSANDATPDLHGRDRSAGSH